MIITDIIEREAMANCVQLLQKKINQSSSSRSVVNPLSPSSFHCKICHRKFPSFQALGGHSASHNKHRQQLHQEQGHPNTSRLATKTTHQCSICGVEFPMGQALGGHMRRHKGIISTAAHHRRHHSSTIDNVNKDYSSEAASNICTVLKLQPAAAVGTPSPPSIRPVDQPDLDDHDEIEPMTKKFKLTDNTFMQDMGLNMCLGRSGHDESISKLVMANDIHDYLQLTLGPPVVY